MTNDPQGSHGTIWLFRGDPDALLRGYDAMVAETPSGSMTLQVCLRAGDGILLIDTCPTREMAEAFVSSPEFAQLRARHGLPAPDRLGEGEVHAAFVDGRRAGSAAAAA